MAVLFASYVKGAILLDKQETPNIYVPKLYIILCKYFTYYILL